MKRRTIASGLALLAVTLVAACGGSPSGPAPVPPPVPPPVPVPANIAPQIESITASVARVEADRDVTLTAVVKDAETAIDQLTFEWKADAGIFTGSGASVIWRAPKDAATPRDYAMSLTVTETYGTADATGARPKHTVSAASPAVRVHDSAKELGDMSIAFLRDFANSSVSPSACLRDFADSCPGKGAERDDIENNRIKFQILSSTLNLSSVSVAGDQVSASMRVACSFTSRRLKCLPDDPIGCTVGAIEPANGICRLTGRYELKRWWLCDSNFDPIGTLSPSMHGFFGSR